MRLTAILVAVALAALPASAAAQKPVYRVAALGDSFASGEGAPDVPGEHNDGGRVIGAREIWDSSLSPGTNAFLDAEHCHRSPRAGGPLAVAALQREFQAIDIDFVNLTCSGAKVIGGVITEQRFFSPDFPGQIVKFAQVERLRQYVRGLGTTHVDAVVMNAGGNDAKFAEIVRRCFNIVNLVGRCDTGRKGRKTSRIAEEGRDNLRTAYDRLDDAFRGRRRVNEAQLDDPPRKVFLTTVPNIATGNGNKPCDAQGDSITNNLKKPEAVFAREEVFEPLQAEFRRAGEKYGWRVVDVAGLFEGHGMCASPERRWVNQNTEAVRRQGEDSATSGFPGVAVSTGFAHPNYDGFKKGYSEAILGPLRRHLVATFTPAGTSPKPLRREGSELVVGFDDLGPARFETQYRARLLDESGSPLSNEVVGFAGQRELRLSLPAPVPARAFLRARRCGPLGSKGCSDASPARPVSFVAPAQPAEIEVTPGQPSNVPGGDGSPALTVAWSHPGGPDLRSFVVAARSAGAKTAVKVVSGPFARGTVLRGLEVGRRYEVSLAACSDLLCSGTIGPVAGSAAARAFTFRGDATRVDPPGVGRASVSPRRSRARAGGTVRLRVGWLHPLNWNELKRVELRLRRGRRVVGRVTLAPGARPGRRLRASGRVRVVRPRPPRPGPLARTVTMRLRLKLSRRLRGRLTIEVGARDRHGVVQRVRKAGILMVRSR